MSCIIYAVWMKERTRRRQNLSAPPDGAAPAGSTLLDQEQIFAMVCPGPRLTHSFDQRIFSLTTFAAVAVVSTVTERPASFDCENVETGSASSRGPGYCRKAGRSARPSAGSSGRWLRRDELRPRL